jgi:Outer membrane protein beta-barrel domain
MHKNVQKYIYSTVLILISMQINAQITLGVNTGITLSTVDFNFSRFGVHSLGGARSTYSGYLSDMVIKNQKVEGYCWYLTAEKIMNEKISLQLEVQYEQRGFHEFSNFNFQSTPVNYDLTVVTSYLALPIILKYNLLKKDNWGTYVNGGLSFAYALTSNQTYYDKGDMRTYNYDFTNSNFNRVDLSVIGGLGMNYLIGKNRLDISCRYSYGLTNTELSDVLILSQNRVILFSLGYKRTL